MRGRFPTAAEGQYRLAVTRRVRALEAATTSQVLARVVDDPPEEERADGLADVLSFIETLRLAWFRVSRPQPDLELVSRQVDAFATREALTGIVEVQRVRALPPIRDLRNAWIETNVQLIRRIDAKHFDRIERIIRDGYAAGTSTRVMGANIAAVGGISKRHGAFIARDQVATLNGRVTRARHLDANVTHFGWMTSEDERVRPEHKARHGKIYAYDAPPPDGVPGEPIGCRCTARGQVRR